MKFYSETFVTTETKKHYLVWIGHIRAIHNPLNEVCIGVDSDLDYRIYASLL